MRKSTLSMGRQRLESTLVPQLRYFASADGSQLFNCEAARNDRDRDAQAAGGLARQVGDQRSRSFGTGSGRENEDRDARLLVDEGQQLVASQTLADVDDWHRAGDRKNFLA